MFKLDELKYLLEVLAKITLKLKLNKFESQFKHNLQLVKCKNQLDQINYSKIYSTC